MRDFTGRSLKAESPGSSPGNATKFLNHRFYDSFSAEFPANREFNRENNEFWIHNSIRLSQYNAEFMIVIAYW